MDAIVKQAIIVQARRNDWYVASKSLPSRDTGTVVEAAFLRELLLGVGGEPERPLAVRLRGVVIRGQLDLRDCSGPGGSGLPPLLLSDCLFIGDAGEPVADGHDPDELEDWCLRAEHACFSRLSLRRCQVGRLNLKRARLLSDLELRELRPLARPATERAAPLCQVYADGVHIEGALFASGTELQIRDGQCLEDDKAISVYALHLANARVAGDVMLQPGFRAVGGVSLRGAVVNGNVWAEGALVSSRGLWGHGTEHAPSEDDPAKQAARPPSQTAAFRCQGLRCLGGVALRNGSRIEGMVDFSGAKVDWLDLTGASIVRADCDAGEQGYAINLSSTHVRTNAWLGAGAASPAPVSCAGAMCLDGCEVGGSLEVDGLHILSEGPRGIDASNCHVRGNLGLSNVLVRSKSATDYGVVLLNARIGGDLNLFGFEASLVMQGSRIEGRLLVKHHCNMQAPSDRLHGLNASNAHVGNSVELHGFKGSVCLAMSRIDGDLSIHSEALVDLDARGVTVHGSVSLRGMACPGERGGLRFDGGKYHGDFNVVGLSYWQDSSRPLKLSIEDAVIERDLVLGDLERVLLQMELIDWRDQMLAFYPGWRLTEAWCRNSDGREMIIAWLQNTAAAQAGGGPLVFLDGQSPPIHELNLRLGLNLDSEHAAREYLKFFCARVWGDLGAFRLLEDPSALPALAPKNEVAFEPIQFTGGDARSGWRFSALVHYGDAVFKADFLVKANGMPEMESDTPLTDVAAPARFTFKPPFRFLAEAFPASESPFWLPDAPGEGPARPRQEIEALLKHFKLPRAAELSLRGLRVGELKHPEKFENGMLLDLQGLEYQSIKVTMRSGTTRAYNSSSQAPASSVQGKGMRRFWPRIRQGLRRDNLPVLGTLAERFLGLSKPESLHLRMLEFQYRNGRINDDQYSPQPYEQLARVLRNQGHFDQAKVVLLKKLAIERKLDSPSLKRGIAWFLDFFFDHGVFVSKGIVFFFAYWLMGAVLFDVANRQQTHPVLVVDAQAVHSLAQGDIPRPVMPVIREGETPSEIWCGDQVDAWWYALDVMIPILDLKQESKCQITGSPEAWGWRLFKVLYSIFGAIVTSIVILAVSGVLRRRVES